LITTLGLCFGVALLAVKLEFSGALGAFLMGAVVSESRESGRITTLTAPLRDMFSAVFFVAIGMMIEPDQIVRQALPVAIGLAVYLPAKIGACALGAFLAGYPAREGLRTGVHMAQVGEFAFVLAGLGRALGLSGDQLYPVIVSLAAVNALVRPYLIDNADRIADGCVRLLPGALRTPLVFYSRWAARLRQTPPRNPALKPVRVLAWQIILNMALIAAIFTAGALAAHALPRGIPAINQLPGGARAIGWIAAALLTLPIYVVTIRKLQAMGMMLAEVSIPAALAVRSPMLTPLLANMLWGAALFGLGVFTLLVSSALLPHRGALLALLATVVVGAAVFGRHLNRLYSRAKSSLVETWSQPPPAPEPPPRPMPVQLRDASLEAVTVRAGPWSGKLIREVPLRSMTGASIVAVERAGRPIINPGPDEELQIGDQLLLLGDREQLAAAARMISDTSGEAGA
jgi:CPA2 family monovalent cation:H+ antiporter-2